MNLFSISPHLPFLDAVAADWLDRAADPLSVADGLILLPTRRAARSLAEAFLRVSGGRALLLPRIMALGALDEGPLAAELAALMDEAERAGIDLAARLPDAADDRFAAHWAETLKFLEIVTEAWPTWLAEQGLMNPAARQVALLDAQAAAWGVAPPVERVLLAGATGGIPAVARLA